MKNKLSYTGCILLMSLVSLGQPQSKNKNIPAVYDEPVRTIICGNIPDANKEVTMEVIDYSRYLQTDWKNSISEYKTRSDQKGDFKFELMIKNPVYVLGGGSFEKTLGFFGVSSTRYVTGLMGTLTEPGDSVFYQVSADNQPAKLKVGGRGSEKVQAIYDMFHQSLKFDCPEYSQNLKRFGLIDSINMMVINTLKKYKLSSTAYTIMKADLIAVLSRDIGELVKEDKYTKLTQLDLLNPAEQQVAVNRLKKMESLYDVRDPALAYCRDFINFVLISRADMQHALDKKSVPSMTLKDFKTKDYETLLKYIPECPLKIRAISDMLMKSATTGLFTRDLEASMKDFLQRFPGNKYNNYYLDVVKKGLDQFGRRLKPGQPAFDFALRDTLDQMVKLKDLRGKVVLLDFMYTGCPGCVGMGRALEKIEPLYHGKDVEFLSISITKELEGTYGVKAGYGVACAKGSRLLYTNGEGSRHPIVSFYQVLGYPTLVLIDKKGNLVKVGNGDIDPRMDGGKALKEVIDRELAKYN